MNIEVTPENHKDCLLIKITAFLLKYTIVYPFHSIEVITMDEAKEKIPVIIGLNKKEVIQLRTNVVTLINKYKLWLKNDKLRT